MSCGYDVEALILAEASRHVIVTAEDDRRPADGEGSDRAHSFPGIHVDAVVHARFGAHPGGCTGLYGPDKAHMARYVAAAQDDAAFAEYLQTHVFEVKDHDEYVERFVPREWQQPARAVGA